MSLWSFGIKTIVTVVSLAGGLAQSQDYLYRDDDLLCRPGWSPDLYYERVQAYESQQRMSYADYQRAMAQEAAAEQKLQEKSRNARRLRAEKDARRREELLAKRKADGLGSPVTRSTSTNATVKSLPRSQ